MKSTLAELAPWIAQGLISGDAEFEGVSTDSRAVLPGNLFIALKGEHFDANDFIADVIARGAAAVIVHRLPSVDVPAIVVPDTRAALADTARYWRGHFAIPVIGVTGSNGKTTVKEMLAAILTAAYGNAATLATRGNLNNDIGVPLTVLGLFDDCRAAVIEMGMNHVGEIALLTHIARPTVGLVNNAQREHQEFMHSVEAVAQENGAVISGLADDGIAVFPADEEFTPLWRRLAGSRRCITFGLTDSADVRCRWTPHVFGSTLHIAAFDQQCEVELAAAGVHNVRNALAATAAALGAGIPIAAIANGLAAFAPVHGRLQKKRAATGATVIDDTYNANPDSVRAAIDVLRQIAAPRILVLGDMGEVGDQGPAFHREVGAYAYDAGIDHLLTLGDLAVDSATAFGPRARHFSAMEALCAALDDLLTSETTVLVKGSRFMKMERVVGHLVAHLVAPPASPMSQPTPPSTQEIH